MSRWPERENWQPSAGPNSRRAATHWPPAPLNSPPRRLSTGLATPFETMLFPTQCLRYQSQLFPTQCPDDVVPHPSSPPADAMILDAVNRLTSGFLACVDRFVSVTGMHVSVVGRNAINDPAFVKSIRNGHVLTLKQYARFQAYMATTVDAAITAERVSAPGSDRLGALIELRLKLGAT